jgi:hypothetical protein
MADRTVKDEAGLARIVEQNMKELEVPPPSIDEADVGLCWGLDWKKEEAAEENPWRNLHVVDLDVVGADRDSRSRDARLWRTAEATDGACTMYWLRNPRHTCLGFFSTMCRDSTIPKQQDFERVLREFAKVRECDWARHMLAALVSSELLDEDPGDLL